MGDKGINLNIFLVFGVNLLGNTTVSCSYDELKPTQSALGLLKSRV